MAPLILVIDDDPGIRSLLGRGLKFEGYRVEAAPDGEAGLTFAAAQRPDLVVLDVMLPGLGGLEVLRRLRAAGPKVPVLMLTARDQPQDEVQALEGGADDYVTKPFSFEVLVARVRALLRRQGSGGEALEYADLRLDPRSHTVRRAGRDIVLTAQEFRLLQAFLEQPGRVQSKGVLLDRAWGEDYFGDPAVVETYVKQLRQKLEGAGDARLIHTIRGVGYVLRLEGEAP